MATEPMEEVVRGEEVEEESRLFNLEGYIWKWSRLRIHKKNEARDDMRDKRELV